MQGLCFCDSPVCAIGNLSIGLQSERCPAEMRLVIVSVCHFSRCINIYRAKVMFSVGFIHQAPLHEDMGSGGIVAPFLTLALD